MTGAADGRVLGARYELGEIVGYGGMAEVHHGRDVRLGREVAIKTLRVDLARDPAFQARFRREAQSAAALNHPAIVAVYDTGEDELDGRAVPYIVMEYVSGQTLREVLDAEGRLHWTRALEITAEVLTALEHAHRHGIIHRDIKPGNVMVTAAGGVKVMDFGIARATAAGSTMTQTSMVLGTAQYLSPEQARGEAVDARSDLYSTGCLLYELVTGRPPFAGDSPVAIAYQHVREDPLPPSRLNADVPGSIDAVVLKALAKHPANRYQSASEMRADVERALAGEPVHATPLLPHPEAPTAAMAAAGLAATQAIPAPGVATSVLRQAGGVGAEGPAGRPPAGGPPRRRRAGPVLLLIAAAVLLGTAAFAISQFVGRSEQASVRVPSVVSASLAEARARLEASGLRVGPIEERNDARPRGTVLDQSPEGGTEVARGSAVSLTVSLGPELVRVPNVVGLSVQEARSTLEGAGMKAGKVSERDSDQPQGRVLAIDPPAGTQVAVGRTVTLTVASGRSRVPDVVGESLARAREALGQAGFDVRVDGPERDDAVVVAQRPGAGESASRGARVRLTTERAPSPTPSESVSQTPPETSTATPESTPSASPGGAAPKDGASDATASPGASRP